jgi:hypothetical protein
MSIDSLTTAARAAGFAMAPPEDPLDELSNLSPESLPALPRHVLAQPERRTARPSARVTKPKLQPAFFDWVAFWRVPA